MRAIVVDDDSLVTEFLKFYLTQRGWTVSTANTFSEGRRLLDSNPDLLVTDVRLGESNGLYLAILARQSNPNVRVLVVSGYDDPVIRRDASNLGADFLLKPFRDDEFSAAVEGLTRRTTGHTR